LKICHAILLHSLKFISKQEKIQQNYFTTEGGDKQQKNGIRYEKSESDTTESDTTESDTTESDTTE